jgi:hypothetical protein
MRIGIRNPRDFAAGVLYVTLGGAALVIARRYGMGTASRMGPGYFPTALGVILILLGSAAIVRSLWARGEPMGAFAWKPALLVTLATVAFGFLLARAGLIVALVVLALVGASASIRFRFDWTAAALLGALVAFCALVFVHGLGVPIPLRGPWLGGS